MAASGLAEKHCERHRAMDYCDDDDDDNDDDSALHVCTSARLHVCTSARPHACAAVTTEC